MRTFLDRMRDLKIQEILQRSADVSIEALREKALDGQCPSNFAEAVKDKGNGLLEIIAEVKARAPGRVNVDSLDSITVVREYAQGGAAAVSRATVAEDLPRRAARQPCPRQLRGRRFDHSGPAGQDALGGRAALPARG